MDPASRISSWRSPCNRPTPTTDIGTPGPPAPITIQRTACIFVLTNILFACILIFIVPAAYRSLSVGVNSEGENVAPWDRAPGRSGPPQRVQRRFIVEEQGRS